MWVSENGTIPKNLTLLSVRIDYLCLFSGKHILKAPLVGIFAVSFNNS